jgi:hypothetical protein
MTKAHLTRLIRDTYEQWHGAGSWVHASNWRKSDWKKMIVGVLEQGVLPDVKPPHPLLPSEIPVPPQPFRPYRADASDPNPED